MYEVLKFIEHGARCRQSMDCVRGSLLICYLRDNPEVEKEILFEWFRQIGVSLDQFQRCRNGGRYRYLNPYSIVVGENKKVYLLDLEAPENEPVMKKMQNRAVRNHFIRQTAGAVMGVAGDADLYGYGKTMQFVLAYAVVTPKLTRREEKRMSRVISRCTENLRSRYSKARQAADDIPSAAKPLSLSLPSGWKTAAAVGCLGVLAAFGSTLYGEGGQQTGGESAAAGNGKSPENTASQKQETTGRAEAEESRTYQDADGRADAEAYISGAVQCLKNCLLQNTSQGNEQAILWGKELELSVVRSLASVYEREEMTEEAIMAYGRLLEIEEGTGQIEDAAEKKMKLEAEQGQYAKAVLTGEEALVRAEDSEKIQGLTEIYRLKLNENNQKEEEADGPPAGGENTDVPENDGREDRKEEADERT